MKRLIVVAALGLSACANLPMPLAEDLAKPAPALMATPRPLPVVEKGDDLAIDSGVCRAEYGVVSGKLLSLQSYVRTIHHKK